MFQMQDRTSLNNVPDCRVSAQTCKLFYLRTVPNSPKLNKNCFELSVVRVLNGKVLLIEFIDLDF